MSSVLAMEKVLRKLRKINYGNMESKLGHQKNVLDRPFFIAC